jgi:hypothetical protein
MLTLLYLLVVTNIIRIFIILVVISVIYWLVVTYIVKTDPYRVIITTLAIILTILWLLREFGLI